MLVGKQKSRIAYYVSRITVLLIVCFALGAIISSIVTPAFAQVPDFGVANLNGLTPLKGGDLRDLILKIIQYLLGFLALIVFLLILYAGWMWMTSGGDAGKIKKAKEIIANAVIGLSIIIFSYAITLFIFKILREMTQGGEPSGGMCTPAECRGCFRCNADGSGSAWDPTCSESCGSLPGGGFQLKSVETANGGSTQNDVFACSHLEGVFNNYVNPATLSSETKIVDLVSGSDVPGTWSVLANTVLFEHPSGGKFIKGTKENPHQYQARFSKSLTDTTGLFLTSCALNAGCTIESTYVAWNFGVGPNDDTEKPSLISAYPTFDSSKGVYPDRNVSPTASLEVTFQESVSVSSFLVPPARDPGSPECQSVPAPLDCFAHPKPGVIFIEAMNPPQKDPGSPECQKTPKPAECLPSASGTVLDPNVFSIESLGRGFRMSFIRPNAFQPFSWYRMTVVGVKDLCGNVMNVPVSWVWQTNGQTPSVTGYPTTGKVCPDSRVFITFGTPMADSRVSLSLFGSDASHFQIAIDAAAKTGVTSVVNNDGTLSILDAQTPIDNGYRQFEFIPARNMGENVTYTVSVSTNDVVASDGSTLAKTWQFTTATTADCECAPLIQRINPAQGPAGMCVTLSGYCFTGTQNHPATPRDLVFGTTPAPIESVSAGFLVTTVPQTMPLATRARPNFTLSYPTSNVGTDNQMIDYFINTSGSASGPCLLSLIPSRGSVDTSVIAEGKRFGSFDQNTSRIIFSPKIESPVSSASWSDVQIQTRVPAGAVRGEVVVQNAVGTSNGIEFVVLLGEGQACSQTPAVCSPDPNVCDSSQGLVCSPSCLCEKKSGGEGAVGFRVISQSPMCSKACTNSVVVARLSKPLLVSSMSDASLRVVSCLTPACNSFGSDIPLSVSYQEDLGAGLFEVVGTPKTFLPVNTSFRVIVASSLTSLDHEGLGGLNYDRNSDSVADSYSWVFGTKSAQCDLERLDVIPQTATLHRMGETQVWSVTALGSNEQCLGEVHYLNPSPLGVVWTNSSDTVASLTPNGSYATSKAVGVGKTVVRAESKGIFDESLLEVLPYTCKTDEQCQNPGNGISCPGSLCDPETEQCLPTITSFSPTTAAIGNLVTLNGCYFGTTPGLVMFSQGVVASFPDPAQCGVSWSDRRVIVEVPRLEIPTNDPSNDAVSGPISLKTSLGFSATTTEPFVVGTQSVPGICRVNPPFGRTGERVSIVGRGFGPSRDHLSGDRVFFSPNRTDASSHVTRWSETSIDVGVPQSAQTGPLEVSNDNSVSNAYHFTVLPGGIDSSCGVMRPDPSNENLQVCSPNQSCAPGLWCETTGKQACTCQRAPAVAVVGVSPEGDNHCRNVQVSVMFNQLMDTKTLTPDSVQLWVGTPLPRARPDLVPETITAGSACSGSPLALTGTIRNAGAANAPSYSARLALGHSSCTVSSLSTHTGAVSSLITCSVAPSAPGSFQLSLEADPNDTLDESDETNNIMIGSVVEVGGPPTAPSGLIVQRNSDTSNDITWSDSFGETGYSLYRGITQSFSTAVKVADITANSTSYTDTQLSCGQTYYYWLESHNACGRLRTQSPVSGQTPTCSDFSLQLNQSSLSFPSGSEGSSVLTVSSVNGKSTSVTFSLSGCPGGAVCTVSPAGACSVTPAASCEKTVSVSSGTAAPGNYQLVIRGESQTGRSEQVTLQITIGNPTDTTPPSCGSVNYSPPLSQWTRGPVTVTVTCSDSGTGCAQPTSSTQVSSNGSGTIPVSDRAEPPNITHCPYTVTNIDTVNPVVAPASETPPGFTMEDTAMGETVTIQTGYPTARWNTGDAESGIARVELWRADYSSVCHETNKAGCLWESRWSDGQAMNEKGRDDTAPIQMAGGNYWYGIHVVDRAGNCVLENNQPCQGGVGNPVHVMMDVQQPDFVLSSPVTFQSIKQNASTTFDVTVVSVGNFSSSVDLTVSGMGPGTSASFSQTSCTPTCAVVLNITTSENAQLGTYTLFVRGVSGTLEHSLPLTLEVRLNDVIAPTVGVAGVPAVWQKAGAALTATCSDSGDGCDSTSLQLYFSPAVIARCSEVPVADYLSSPQEALSHGWVCATALDRAGNRGFSNPMEVKVDQIAPTAVSFEGASETCGEIHWSIIGAADAGGSQLHPQAFSFDNGVLWQTQPTFVESKPSGGQSTRIAQVRDNAGNVWISESVTATAVECDVTPPTLSFDSQSRPWGNTDVFVTITASDPSGVATTRHCVTTSSVCDPGTTPDTDTFTSGVAIRESREGSWTFCARAKDTVGNWSQSPVCTSGQFHIDKTAPVIQSFNVEGVSFGQPRPINSDGSLDIAWSVSDAGGSGLGRVEIWRASDNAGTPADWGTAPVFTSQSSSGVWVDTQTNGTYWYGIHAVDNTAPDPNCITGDVLGPAKGHCGGVTADSEDANRQPRDPVAVDVAIPVPSFTISLSPANVTVAQGINAQYSVSVSPVNGFTADVSGWAVKPGTCPGNAANCSFSFTTCPPVSYANCGTLTIATSALTPNNYPGIVVTAVSGDISKESNAVTLSMNDPWWNLAWTKRRKIIIQNSGVSSDQVNVPVLVVLKQGQRINYSDTQAGGADIRFVDRDGTTILAHEIESWNPGGDSYLWVNIPQIDRTPTVDYLWMYYGNPTPNPQPSSPPASSVWDASYRTVWHMAGGGTSLVNSTGVPPTTIPSSWSLGSGGMIGGGLTFSARAPGQGGFVSSGISDGADWTIELWYKGVASDPASTGFDAFVLTSGRWDGLTVGSFGAGSPAPSFIDWTAYNAESVGVNREMNTTDFGRTSFDYYVITGDWAGVDSSTGRFTVYKNGVVAGTFSARHDPTPTIINLGTEKDEPQSGAVIDEFRASTVLRSDTWIAIQYSSMTDTLLTYESEQVQVSSLPKTISPFHRFVLSFPWANISHLFQESEYVIRWLLGRDVVAQDVGGVLVPTQLSFSTMVSGSSGCFHPAGCTVVYLRPVHALAANTAHSLYVASGVRSAYGVVLAADDIRLNQFTTGSEWCSLTDVELIPSKLTFTTRGEERIMTAVPMSGGTVITGFPGVYDWSYSWSNGGSSSFTLTPLSPPASATVRAVQNGRGTVTATLTVTSDTVNTPPTAGHKVVGSASVDVFFCEHPWIYENTDHHMVMRYCLDGDPLLPSFSNPPKQNVHFPTLPSGDRMLFDGLFLRGGGSPDAIGLRVYSNMDRRDVREWYNRNITQKGSPSATTVDGFNALREGRTVYISAINGDDIYVPNVPFYTNIYVLSYNEGADSVTRSIFEELVKNTRFLTGVTDAGDRESLKRDAVRLTTVGTILNAVREKGSCPVLAGGTFLSGRSTSAWPSWQGQLVSELGVRSLERDPLNTFLNCPEGYDPVTCWNSATRDFQCPAGSHVLQYYFDPSGSCWVSVNLETKGILWSGNPPLASGESDACDSTLIRAWFGHTQR